MVDEVRRPKRLRDIVEESQHWQPEDLLRNMDERMRMLDLGLCHIVLDSNDRIVSRCPRPLPAVPRFTVDEDRESFSLRVLLPNVSDDNVHVDVDRRSVEVFACSDDPICKPYYVDVEAKGTLEPDSVEAKRDGNWVEIRVKKAKKRKVEIR